MKFSTKFFIFLMTSALAAPTMAETFRPYRDTKAPPLSFNIGLGISHGGEELNGITIQPVGVSTYYSEDKVNLGGEQSYFIGGILSVSMNSELWFSYGKMEDDVNTKGNYVSVSDPNLDLNLKHDRYEFMYFWKNNNFRLGGGFIMDKNIVYTETYTGGKDTYDFDDAKGWGLGAGLDMPFNENGAALHFDFRYIKMNYHINDIELNANSIGYFVSASF